MRRLLALLILLGLGACAASQPSLGDPALDAGQKSYQEVCAACHGPTGAGTSAPALSEVLATFPDCSTQQQWIRLGSEAWKDEVGETYGAQDKEITAIMPTFRPVLSETEIAQVAAFERFQFGGATMEEALTGCGLS